MKSDLVHYFDRADSTDLSHFRVTTGAHGCDYPIEASVALIVHDPSSLIIFVHLFDLGIELGFALKSISLPKLLNLIDDLFAVGVSLIPLYGWMETVHYRVDLEA